MIKSLIWSKVGLMLILSSLLPAVFAADNLILVGTTGDYPPLTKATESGFVGRDIDLIKQFAQDNYLTIKFVKTSWQTLSDDLQNGKFLIGVGGISYNQKRAELFNTSLAIESSAKVAMIRCTDLAKFHSFKDIDQESITVIENRGGTNQEFALAHIKNARISIVKQNESAINSLITIPPLADVMFTDDTEVGYRHMVNPNLCQASLLEEFPGSPKVFLFSKNQRGLYLVQKFNLWWGNISNH